MGKKTDRQQDIASRIAAIEKLTSELQEIVKKEKEVYRGGIMSRERIEMVWNLLAREKPITVEQIVGELGLKKPIVQKALYVLLAEGRATRTRVEQEVDVGRPIYQYCKMGSATAEPIKSEQPDRFDMENMLAHIPQNRKDALSIGEIAEQINGSVNTVRMKIAVALAAGVVEGVRSRNERNQEVMKYYRMGSKNVNSSQSAIRVSQSQQSQGVLASPSSLS